MEQDKGVTVIHLNKLPEKITVIINWTEKRIIVCRHSIDAFKLVRDTETVNEKPVSYHVLRRRLKSGQVLKLDSGSEIMETVLIN